MSRLRVLVACEFSGVVRRAFRELGHEAWSCDLLPAEDGSPHHFMADALQTAKGKAMYFSQGGAFMHYLPWDLVVCHPPCTFLCNSGVRWLYKRYADGRSGHSRVFNPVRVENMKKGARFFADLWRTAVDSGAAVCMENPVMHWHASREIEKCLIGWTGPSPWTNRTKIDPRDFGHTETKATHFYLHNLPALVPTDRVHSQAAALSVKDRSRVHYASPGPDRWKERSRTLPGIAKAMAEQWSHYLTT